MDIKNYLIGNRPVRGIIYKPNMLETLKMSGDIGAKGYGIGEKDGKFWWKLTTSSLSPGKMHEVKEGNLIIFEKNKNGTDVPVHVYGMWPGEDVKAITEN